MLFVPSGPSLDLDLGMARSMSVTRNSASYTKSLCQEYGLDPQSRLIFGSDHVSWSGKSCFIPAMGTIVLRGRLSVVTYLHELAHARGMNGGKRVAGRSSLQTERTCPVDGGN
jgi:hypothetical protein